jgi:hypothetical protein
VPVQSLIDVLEDGETIEGFLRLYPAITKQTSPHCTRLRQRPDSGMRILIDECVDPRVRNLFGDHPADAVHDNGSDALEDGSLLALAQEEFDADHRQRH